MQKMICDACHRPMDREGFELSLLRAAVVASGTEIPHLTNIIGNNGVLSAALCLRCGERLSAIIRHKLQDPRAPPARSRRWPTATRGWTPERTTRAARSSAAITPLARPRLRRLPPHLLGHTLGDVRVIAAPQAGGQVLPPAVRQQTDDLPGLHALRGALGGADD